MQIAVEGWVFFKTTISFKPMLVNDVKHGNYIKLSNDRALFCPILELTCYINT